jgi:hypothetical protein
MSWFVVRCSGLGDGKFGGASPTEKLRSPTTWDPEGQLLSPARSMACRLLRLETMRFLFKVT